MKLNSHAKINLSLEILNKRPDGYHNILSVFQLIDLHDEIDIRVINSGHINIVSNNSDIPTDESNICYKVAELMLGYTDHHLGVEINISKNIPIGSGLGGGSSNAAITFLLLNHMLNLLFSTDKLIEISKKLGADIPFFISEYATAKVEDTGETITKLPNLKEYPTALIIPNHKKESTKKAYENLVLSDLKLNGIKTKSLVQNIVMQNFTRSIMFIHNDFEKYVFTAIPYLKSIKNTILTMYKPIACSLTGSGPVLYAIFEHNQQLSNFVDNFKYKGIKIISTKLYQPEISYKNLLLGIK